MVYLYCIDDAVKGLADERLQQIKLRVYAMTEHGLYSDPDTPELTRAEMDRFSLEAERLVAP